MISGVCYRASCRGHWLVLHRSPFRNYGLTPQFLGLTVSTPGRCSSAVPSLQELPWLKLAAWPEGRAACIQGLIDRRVQQPSLRPNSGALHSLLLEVALQSTGLCLCHSPLSPPTVLIPKAPPNKRAVCQLSLS